MIKRILLITFCALILSTSFGQKSNLNAKCRCSVLVDPSFRGNITVFDSPNGKVKKKIQHNIAEDDFVVLSIIGKQGSFFEVVAEYSIAGHIVDGWIKIDNPVGIFTRNYDGKPLHLFQMPNADNKPVYTIKDYSPLFLKMTDCNINGWIKVKFDHKDSKRQGWLPIEGQCDNPYTTCN
jgi:hypothetical protein